MSASMGNNEKNSQIRLAIKRFGKLVKWGSRLTFTEFAKQILKFAEDTESRQLAETVGQVSGQIWHGRNGLCVTWQGI
ncbi:hypothetical protein [Chromobacterium vaccinii]|uniref:hypothetical protein n=1 Tax=Chromobacterium vaccinii TaxID=1108595 RepID=UPI00345A46D4